MIKKLFISSIAFTGIVMSQDNSASVQETSVDSLMNDSTLIAANNVEEFVAKEKSGFNIGFTGSAGFVNGAYITNTPVGGSLVITTPFGYSSGSLDFTISLVVGSYNGEGENEPLEALLYGVGANATLFNMVFSETHLGMIGAGVGARNFSGVSLERLISGAKLPINVLIGGEGFILTKADDRSGNSTFWGGLGVRLDYSF